MKIHFSQKIDDWLVNTIQIPLFRWTAHKERIHLRVFSTWGIGQRGHMRSTFSKKHEKGKCYKKDVRNPTPWFLQFWAFQALRIVRIDPSRQVSMDAARMGFPSATEALNKLKDIKKSKNTPKPGNIYIYIYIYSLYIPYRLFGVTAGVI